MMNLPVLVSCLMRRRRQCAMLCGLALGATAFYPTALRAQDDDDSVFVAPRWAQSVVDRQEEGDLDGALSLLKRLAPAHRGSYALPLLQARVWGDKAVEIGGPDQLAALKQERIYLLQAQKLMRGSQMAALASEITRDLRINASNLQEAGYSPPREAPTMARKAAPARTRPVPVPAQAVRPAAAPKAVPAKASTGSAGLYGKWWWGTSILTLKDKSYTSYCGGELLLRPNGTYDSSRTIGSAWSGSNGRFTVAGDRLVLIDAQGNENFKGTFFLGRVADPTGAVYKALTLKSAGGIVYGLTERVK